MYIPTGIVNEPPRRQVGPQNITIVIMMKAARQIAASRQLMRQFIEESLYDPGHGYFARNANIFKLDSPLRFGEMLDIEDYQRTLFKLYQEKSIARSFYQLWHTPSELFQPHYAQAIGKYIVSKQKSASPLVIYEVGPGNGTLCEGITSFLDNLKIDYQYHLIEISAQLHQLQRQKFSHNNRVKLINRSFLEWQQVESRECFVLAFEVWDNLSQDIIGFSSCGDLLQGVVVHDESAKYYDIPGKLDVSLVPASDKLISETVAALDDVEFKWRSLDWSPRQLFKFLGFNQAYKWQYIPTGIMSFLKVIGQFFPQSSLIVSDFDYLPDTTPGFGAPVVQTRYNGDTINCSTILLQKGLFDIFFPTNFDVVSRLFCKMVKKQASVLKHKHFLEKYADCSSTSTRSGYNPMLEEFENVSFFLS